MDRNNTVEFPQHTIQICSNLFIKVLTFEKHSYLSTPAKSQTSYASLTDAQHLILLYSIPYSLACLQLSGVTQQTKLVRSRAKRAWKEEKLACVAPSTVPPLLCDYHMCWLHDLKTHMSGNKRSEQSFNNWQLPVPGICRIPSVQN